MAVHGREPQSHLQEQAPHCGVRLGVWVSVAARAAVGWPQLPLGFCPADGASLGLPACSTVKICRCSCRGGGTAAPLEPSSL